MNREKFKSVLRLGFILGVIGVSLYFIEFRPYSRAVAVVAIPREVIRYEQRGFVERIPVVNGQFVEKGGIVATVVDSENNTVDLHAPIGGRVSVENPKQLQGSPLQPGSKIMSIFPNEPPNFIVSAPLRAAQALEAMTSEENLSIKLSGRSGETFQATPLHIERKATKVVPDISFVSHLRVEKKVIGGVTTLEFLSPRFNIFTVLTAGKRDATKPLQEGEWGYTKLYESEKLRLGSWIYREVSRSFLN